MPSLTPSRIVLRHSNVSGEKPVDSDLLLGEIFINIPDNKLYYKNRDSINPIIEIDLTTSTDLINIRDVDLNSEGVLVARYSNNTSKALGNVVGPAGRGLAIDGVVNYVNQLPNSSTIANVLNKNGTLFIVREGLNSATPGVKFSPVGPRIYSYSTASSGTWTELTGATVAAGDVGPRGNSILHGFGAPTSFTGEIDDFYLDTIEYKLYGPKSYSPYDDSEYWPDGIELQGPVGEVTAESLDQLLDDLGLGPTDIVPVVGLQLSDTGTVALDDGTLGLNSSGELILHNGLANGNELPTIKAGGSLTQATSFVSGTDFYLTDLEYPFKIAEFNIPFNQVSTVGDLLNLNGKISLKFDLINPYQTFVLPDSGIYLIVALDDSVIVSPGAQPYGALYYPYFNKHQSNNGNSTFKIESDININIENVDSFAEEISLQTRFTGGIKNTIFKNTQGVAPIVATTYHDEWLDLGDGSLMEFQQYIPRPVNENAFIKIPIYIVGVDYTGNPARPMYCSSVLNLSKTIEYQTP